MNDVHLIIRAAGERTADISRRLAIVSGIAENDITTVSEVPFEVALGACYEAAVRAGKKWTMTLDADVLMMKSATSRLLGFAEEMPSHFFQMQGRIFDNITGVYRQAGPRIYRTELLPLALKYIPGIGAQIRPESYTITQMVGLGYPSRLVPMLSGLHDFEQYYADLYRKSFVHARKHSELLPDLIVRCARLMHGDADFLVILKGLWDSLITQGAVTIDAGRYGEQAARALESLGIAEKSPIVDSDGFVKRFDSLFDDLRSAYPVPDFFVLDSVPPSFSSEIGAPSEGEQRSWVEKTLERIAERGPVRGSIASFGALLRLAGQVLDR